MVYGGNIPALFANDNASEARDVLLKIERLSVHIKESPYM